MRGFSDALIIAALSGLLGVATGLVGNYAVNVQRVAALEAHQADLEKRLDRIEGKLDAALRR